jgi:hypothetical protein
MSVLLGQPQQRLGLDVEDGSIVGPSGDLVVALEEEAVELLDRRLTCALACVVERLVEVLRRPIRNGSPYY